MSDKPPHGGDIGYLFTVTITDDAGTALDISDATTLQLRFKSPSRTLKTLTAIFATDGTNGKIQYTTANATDLDMPGRWSIQARVVAPNYDKSSETDTFTVLKNL